MIEKIIYNEDGTLDGEVVVMYDGHRNPVWRFVVYRTRLGMKCIKKKDWMRNLSSNVEMGGIFGISEYETKQQLIGLKI